MGETSLFSCTADARYVVNIKTVMVGLKNEYK